MLNVKLKIKFVRLNYYFEDAMVITQLVVYQANKVATLAELWCNGSMPGRDSGDIRCESSKL